MKLWHLTAKEERAPWQPWFDKAFGFVIRAETEERARKIADENGEDENRKGNPWLDPGFSICEEILTEGEESLILKDFRAA